MIKYTSVHKAMFRSVHHCLSRLHIHDSILNTTSEYSIARIN